MQSTFSLVEHPVNPSRSRDCEKDWMTRVATSPLPLEQLLLDIAPVGSFGKMSMESFQATEEKTLQDFWDSSRDNRLPLPSKGGKTAEPSRDTGAPMGFRGVHLTLNTLESPKDVVVCSLSDTLEIGDVHPRHYLSAIACRGILRRIKKRGKPMPEALVTSLQFVADTLKSPR